MKNKITFFKDFGQSLFWISYLQKIVPIGLAHFGNLPILKRDLELGCCTHFVHNFSIETFLKYYSTNWASLKSDLNYFPRYSSECILKLLLRHFMTSWNVNVTFNQLLLQWPNRAEMKGRRKYKEINTSRTKRAFYVK